MDGGKETEQEVAVEHGSSCASKASSPPRLRVREVGRDRKKGGGEKEEEISSHYDQRRVLVPSPAAQQAGTTMPQTRTLANLVLCCRLLQNLFRVVSPERLRSVLAAVFEQNLLATGVLLAGPVRGRGTHIRAQYLCKRIVTRSRVPAGATVSPGSTRDARLSTQDAAAHPQCPHTPPSPHVLSPHTHVL